QNQPRMDAMHTDKGSFSYPRASVCIRGESLFSWLLVRARADEDGIRAGRVPHAYKQIAVRLLQTGFAQSLAVAPLVLFIRKLIDEGRAGREIHRPQPAAEVIVQNREYCPGDRLCLGIGSRELHTHAIPPVVYNVIIQVQ